MKDARFGAWVTWVAVGVFGYVTGIRFFEALAAIGIVAMLFYEAVDFVAKPKPTPRT